MHIIADIHRGSPAWDFLFSDYGPGAYRVRLAVDPLEPGLKVKVNEFTWSHALACDPSAVTA